MRRIRACFSPAVVYRVSITILLLLAFCFDLKKFDDEEVKEKYQREISNRFAALETLDESSDINNAWKSIRENIKTSAKDNL
jgi:hypothetical protein